MAEALAAAPRAPHGEPDARRPRIGWTAPAPREIAHPRAHTGRFRACPPLAGARRAGGGAVLLHLGRLRHALVAVRAVHRLAGIRAGLGALFRRASLRTPPGRAHRHHRIEPVLEPPVPEQQPARGAPRVPEDAVVADSGILACEPRADPQAQRRALLQGLL